MKELYEKNKLFFIILACLVIGFLAWYFAHVIILVLIAGVVSIIGSPLVNQLDKIRIGKVKIPHGLNAMLVLLVIFLFFLAVVSFFIPLIIEEASMIAAIDPARLTSHFDAELRWLYSQMVSFGVIEQGRTIESLVKENMLKIIDFGLFSNILAGIITFAGTFLFNVFSVLFLSYFFLYDTKMLPNTLLLLVSEKYTEKTEHVLQKSRQLLSRYFIGLLLDCLCMMVTYAVGLSIFGVKGALVIAFFGGIINVVPYFGHVLAVFMGIILGVTGDISIGAYASIGNTILTVLIVMLTAVLLDDVLYQPFIQGKSMKAHPVEIFLVIIAAASIGGIVAMVIAVPCYAFLRIVAKEFLSQFRLVQKMTENI